MQLLSFEEYKLRVANFCSVIVCEYFSKMYNYVFGVEKMSSRFKMFWDKRKV